MPSYALYDKRTGEILRVLDCSASQINMQLQNENEAYVEARTPNDDIQYVDIATKQLRSKQRGEKPWKLKMSSE